jgi:hypothetical protein
VKNKQAKSRAWPVATGLILLPSVAWAHDPHGFAVAALVSLPFVIVLGIVLARVGWKLGRKFTTNRSKRVSFIVSLLAAIVAAVVSFMSWPLFFGVTYWVYDSLS